MCKLCPYLYYITWRHPSKNKKQVDIKFVHIKAKTPKGTMNGGPKMHKTPKETMQLHHSAYIKYPLSQSTSHTFK